MCNFKQKRKVHSCFSFAKFVIRTDLQAENLLRTLTSNALVANLSEMLLIQRNLKVSCQFLLAKTRECGFFWASADPKFGFKSCRAICD